MIAAPPNQRPRRSRPGFTLVEIMVAMALIIFVMLILTQSFVAGMEAFRQLKAIGDQEEKLRMAVSVLRKDLVADHFEGRRRLSEPNFWAAGPPREGFFRLWQGSPSVLEGADDDGIPSYRATNHYLHFTVKRRGNLREEFATTPVPNPPPAFLPPLPAGQAPPPPFGGNSVWTPDSRFQPPPPPPPAPGTFSSQWYEVVYFLKDTGETTPGGTRRYTLCRRQRLLVCDNQQVNWVNTVGQAAPNAPVKYDGLSCEPNPAGGAYAGRQYFNNPMDITVPQRRFGMDPGRNGGWPSQADLSYPLIQGNNAGTDQLLTDVISFQVQPMIDTNGFFDIANPLVAATKQQLQAASGNNPVFYNPNNPAAGANLPAVFDTWSSVKDDAYDYSAWATKGAATSVPLQLPLRALKISIRIWDVKTQLTRQITIVQDL